MLRRFRLLFFCFGRSGWFRRSGFLRFFKLMRVISVFGRFGRRREFHSWLLRLRRSASLFDLRTGLLLLYLLLLLRMLL